MQVINGINYVVCVHLSTCRAHPSIIWVVHFWVVKLVWWIAFWKAKKRIKIVILL